MNPAATQAILHEPFEYGLQGDTECDSLDPFSGHATPFEEENDTSTSNVFRQPRNAPLAQASSAHPLSLQSTGNYDHRTPAGHAANDLSFPPAHGVSMTAPSSSRGSSSTSPTSGSSTISFQSSQNHYVTNNNVSYNVGSQSTSPSYSPSTSYNQSFLQGPIEARPRLSSISWASGMPPPPRHSVTHIPASPNLVSTFRNDYSSSPSHLPRHAFSSHSIPYHLSQSPQSPLSAMSRSLDSASGRESPASTAHFSFASPMQIEVSSHMGANGQTVPPFDPTEPFCQLSDKDGRSVQPEIHAKIDKGFFRTDQDWTCYRRNYFSVACSYGIGPSRSDLELERVCLIRQGSPVPILGFYMCIAAKVDGEDGKPIELVQHTPKRDKGPMTQPEKKELKPNPSGNLGLCTTATGFGSSQSLAADYEASYLGSPQDSQNVATFERIQFKKATANNGKRRAAQQYFHIVVELFVKVYKIKGNDTEFVKIAHRVSAQMVVRGRSPGHYQDERRGSSTNMGPGSGSGGDFGTHTRDSGPGNGSLGSHTSLSGSHYQTRMSHGGYQTHHSAINYSTGPGASLPSNVPSSLASSFDQFMEPLPSNEIRSQARTPLDNSGAFPCYTSASYENSCPVSRPTVGQVTLTSSGTSPTALESATSYSSMATIKEEPSLKNPKIEESHRLGNNYNSIQLPIGKWLNSPENYHPPRDCRTMQLDTSRSYYTAPTPAAW